MDLQPDFGTADDAVDFALGLDSLMLDYLEINVHARQGMMAQDFFHLELQKSADLAGIGFGQFGKMRIFDGGHGNAPSV